MDAQQVMDYIQNTTIYGRFKVWHLLLFLTLGPMLTWPMLIILGLVFAYENRNIVKDFKGILTSNGDNQRPVSGSAGRDQGTAQGPSQGEAASRRPIR